MTRFLQTHRSVMLASLQSAGVLQHGATTGVDSVAAPAEPLRMASPPGQPQVKPPEVAPAAIAHEPVLQTQPQEAASAAAPATLTIEMITTELVKLVSNRTGYPPEMLNVDLDLEADLGIDSIKRVEIVSELQSSSLFPGQVMEGDLEALTRLKTLRAIVGWIVDHFAQASSAVAGAPSEERAPAPAPKLESTGAPAGELTRLLVRVIDASSIEVQEKSAETGTVIITDDGAGAASRLAQLLGAAGVPCTIIGEFDQASRNGDSQAAHLADASAVGKLIGTARGLGRPITAFVHLAALGKGATPDGVSARLEYELKSLFVLARELERDLRGNTGSRFIAATALGGAFGFDGQIPKEAWPGFGGVCGFTKSLSREWPEVGCRVVDFGTDADSDYIADALLAELSSTDRLLEVGYSNGRRVTLMSEAAPLGGTPAAAMLDERSVVVVTGGARGITAEICVEIAQRFQARLILAGRSPLPIDEEAPETAGVAGEKALKSALIQTIERQGGRPTPADVEHAYRKLRRERETRVYLAAMRAAGSAVEYHSVDAGDEKAFGRFLEDIYNRHGRIDGVIHGAGIIEDKLLRDKTWESFERVLRPKVAGALTLSRKLRPESLRFLTFFSSVSARYGNRGQCDYAAANEIMNKLAADLARRWAGRVVSFDWGPWQTAQGMVSAELAGRFAQAGVQMVPLQEGRRAYVAELLSGETTATEVVLGGPIPKGRSLEASAEPASLERSPILAGSRSAQRTNGTIQFVLETDAKRHVYLLDHQLDGKPVMPMAMVLELVSEAAAIAKPGMEVSRIRDFRLLNGITYANGDARALRVEISGEQAGLDGSQIIDLSVKSDAEPTQVHYRARVELNRVLDTGPQPASLQLVAPQELGIGIREAYERWLFHGPRFAGIRSVEALGDNGIIGILESSVPSDFFSPAVSGNWMIDPLMVDSGLQMLILWARTYLDQTPLPSSLGCYHRYRGPSGKVVRCEAEIRHQRGNAILRADLNFFDQRRRLIGRMEDMRVTCSRELNRLAQVKAAAVGAS